MDIELLVFWIFVIGLIFALIKSFKKLNELKELLNPVGIKTRIIVTIIVLIMGTFLAICFSTDNFGQGIISGAVTPLTLRIISTIFMSLLVVGQIIYAIFAPIKK